MCPKNIQNWWTSWFGYKKAVASLAALPWIGRGSVWFSEEPPSNRVTWLPCRFVASPLGFFTFSWGARARSGTSLRLFGHRSGTNGRRTRKCPAQLPALHNFATLNGPAPRFPIPAPCSLFPPSPSPSLAAFSISWLIVLHAAFGPSSTSRHSTSSELPRWHIKFHN